MQCKDIRDDLILGILDKHQGHWSMFRDVKTEVDAALGGEIPWNLFRAKMSRLIDRGLVGGCGCGCRGDFEITDKGLALIGRPRYAKYTGY